MSTAETLHLLVGAPPEFMGDVHASLMIGCAIGGVQRNTNRTCIADDGHSGIAGLELLHAIDVDMMHGDAFRGPLLIVGLPGPFVADKAPASAGDLGNIEFAKVIDKLVQRVFRQMESGKAIEQSLLQFESFFALDRVSFLIRRDDFDYLLADGVSLVPIEGRGEASLNQLSEDFARREIRDPRGFRLQRLPWRPGL